MIRQSKIQSCLHSNDYIKFEARSDRRFNIKRGRGAELTFFVTRPLCEPHEFQTLVSYRWTEEHIVGIPCFKKLSSEYAIGTNERIGDLCTTILSSNCWKNVTSAYRLENQIFCTVIDVVKVQVFLTWLLQDKEINSILCSPRHLNHYMWFRWKYLNMPTICVIKLKAIKYRLYI